MKDCGYKHEMPTGTMDEETRYPQLCLSGDAAVDFPKEGEHDIKVRVRVIGTRNPSSGSPSVDLEVLKVGSVSASVESEDDEMECEDESPLGASIKRMRNKGMT